MQTRIRVFKASLQSPSKRPSHVPSVESEFESRVMWVESESESQVTKVESELRVTLKKESRKPYM